MLFLVTFSRRQFLAGAAGSALTAATAQRPNIVFIFTYDHHYQCFGAAGNPHIRTPNMDRIAAQGVHFTNAVASTSQCAPNRGIVLSGRETFQTGLRSNGAMTFAPDAGPTVIEQLRRAGYDTSVVGKWHIPHQPAECGFANAPLWLEAGASKYIDPVLRRGSAPAKQETGHITDLFTDEAIRLVRTKRQQPYFLWLAYNAPHSPWHAQEKTLKEYANAAPPPRHAPNSKPFNWTTYYSVITELDTAIGRLLEAVDWTNTVVFLMGDNGFMCGAKGLGGKVVAWDESVRVPCAVAGASVQKGARVDDPVASIDLPATWLDLAGVKSTKPLSGRSLKKVLITGKDGPDDAFVVWDDGRVEALTVKQAIEPYRIVRTRRHKLIVWESKKQAVFDHVEDIAEERNLVADPKYASVVRDLRSRLQRRMKATNDRALAWL
jgi:N-acetylglucosamine-6-sulfatase